MFINEGTAVGQAQPEDPDLCIGRSVAFHPEVTPPPPDRLYPGQLDSTKPGFGRPISFQSPSVYGKDHRNRVQLTQVKDVGFKLAAAEEIHSYELKMMSKDLLVQK